MENELLVGLDVGSKTVKIAVAELDEDNNIHIKSLEIRDSKGIQNGTIRNMDAACISVQDAVRAIEEGVGCDIDFPIYVSFGSAELGSILEKGIFAIKQEYPEKYGAGKTHKINQLDLDNLLKKISCVTLIPSSSMVIDAIPVSYCIDNNGKTDNPIGAICRTRMDSSVYVIYDSTNGIEDLETCVESIGLELNDVVPESLAAPRSVVEDEEIEVGVAVIDIGDQITNLSVYVNRNITLVENFAFGGLQMSKDIAYAAKTTYEYAEKIKKTEVQCLIPNQKLEGEISVPGIGGRADRLVSKHELSYAATVRAYEMFKEIFNKLEEKDLLKDLGAGIVITGGVARLEGIVEFLEATFNVSVKIGRPKVEGGIAEKAKDPIYATVIGLLDSARISKREECNITRELEVNGNRGDGFFDKMLYLLKKFF